MGVSMSEEKRNTAFILLDKLPLCFDMLRPTSECAVVIKINDNATLSARFLQCGHRTQVLAVFVYVESADLLQSALIQVKQT